jgi:hypothetical protein
MNTPIINSGYLLVLRVDSCIVWFILIKSWVYSQLFVILEESYWLAQQQYFWIIGNAPNRSTSLPSCKMKTSEYPKFISAPLNFIFLVYIQGSWTLGKPYGIKPRYYWEHIGNKGKKEKNWNIHEGMLSLPIGCMKFLFPKLLVTIFGLGSWQGQKFGLCVTFIKRSGWKSLPTNP